MSLDKNAAMDGTAVFGCAPRFHQAPDRGPETALPSFPAAGSSLGEGSETPTCLQEGHERQLKI